jgi:hypothetical protein
MPNHSFLTCPDRILMHNSLAQTVYFSHFITLFSASDNQYFETGTTRSSRQWRNLHKKSVSCCKWPLTQMTPSHDYQVSPSDYILLKHNYEFLLVLESLSLWRNIIFTPNKYEQHQCAIRGEKLFTNKFASIQLYTYWVQSTILDSLYNWELQHL